MKINHVIILVAFLTVFACKKEKESFSFTEQLGLWNWVEATPEDLNWQTFFRNSFCPPIYLHESGQFARVCRKDDPIEDITFHTQNLWEIQDSKFIINSFSNTIEMEIIEMSANLMILEEEISGTTFQHRLERF